MTAQEIFSTALSITGYNNTSLFDTNFPESQMICIINSIYSELYFIKNKNGFTAIETQSDTINLEEKEIYDCMAYGIAALISKTLGCDDDFTVFHAIYRHKTDSLKKHCEIKSISDTLPKGCDF